MNDLVLRLDADRIEAQLRCGSAGSGTMMAIALPLTACALGLPWWNGESSSSLIGEEAGLTASVSLWELEVAWLSDGQKQTYSSMWDTACADDVPGEATCHTVRFIRFSLFATAGLVFTAILAASGANGCGKRRPSLLQLLAATVLDLCAAGGAGTCLLFAAGLDANGLRGPGAICVLAVLGLSLAASYAAVFAAYKAAPRADLEEFPGQRMRRARAARRDAATLRERLDASAKAADLPEEAGARSSEAEARRSLPELERVLFWSDTHGSSEAIPIPMLEAAFNEIDDDRSGRIDSDELGGALHLCGLKASPEALDGILKDIDRNMSGDIDIHEFVDFFQMVQEIDRNGRKVEARQALNTCLCRLCFVVHVAVISALGLTASRLDDSDSTQRDFFLELAKILCGTFFILFVCVICAPLARLILGPSLAVWSQECMAAIPVLKWRRRRGSTGEACPGGPGTAGGPRGAALVEGGGSDVPEGSLEPAVALEETQLPVVPEVTMLSDQTGTGEEALLALPGVPEDQDAGKTSAPTQGSAGSSNQGSSAAARRPAGLVPLSTPGTQPDALEVRDVASDDELPGSPPRASPPTRREAAAPADTTESRRAQQHGSNAGSKPDAELGAFEGYDPSAFKDAAMRAMNSPQPRAFSVMHADPRTTRMLG